MYGTAMYVRRLVGLRSALIAIALWCSPNAAAVAQSLYVTVPAASGFNETWVPPITTYRWTTIGGHPNPAEVRQILVNTAGFEGDWAATQDYIRNNPNAPEWSPWQSYSPPSTGTYWTTPWQPGGYYVFAVQGRDELGNEEPNFDLLLNMRRIRVIAPVPTESESWGHIKVLYSAERSRPN